MLYRGIPKDQWPTVASWRDERIDADTGLAMLTRSYLCNLVYRMTRWKHDGVYARVCEWAGVAQAQNELGAHESRRNAKIAELLFAAAADGPPGAAVAAAGTAVTMK